MFLHNARVQNVMFIGIVNSEEFEGDNWQNQLPLWLPARPTYFTVIARANTRKVSDQIQIQIQIQVQAWCKIGLMLWEYIQSEARYVVVAD